MFDSCCRCPGRSRCAMSVIASVASTRSASGDTCATARVGDVSCLRRRPLHERARLQHALTAHVQRRHTLARDLAIRRVFRRGGRKQVGVRKDRRNRRRRRRIAARGGCGVARGRRAAPQRSRQHLSQRAGSGGTWLFGRALPVSATQEKRSGTAEGRGRPGEMTPMRSRRAVCSQKLLYAPVTGSRKLMVNALSCSMNSADGPGCGCGTSARSCGDTSPM